MSGCAPRNDRRQGLEFRNFLASRIRRPLVIVLRRGAWFTGLNWSRFQPGSFILRICPRICGWPMVLYQATLPDSGAHTSVFRCELRTDYQDQGRHVCPHQQGNNRTQGTVNFLIVGKIVQVKHEQGICWPRRQRRPAVLRARCTASEWEYSGQICR